MFKFYYQNEKKRKSWKKCSGLQNGAIKGIQIGACFRDYKPGQEELEVGVVLGISNRGKKITNRGKEISVRDRDYKSRQKGFQKGAGITNRCRTRTLLIQRISLYLLVYAF